MATILRDRGARVQLPDTEVAAILCQAVYDDDLATIKRYVLNGTNPGCGGTRPAQPTCCSMFCIDPLLSQFRVMRGPIPAQS